MAQMLPELPVGAGDGCGVCGGGHAGKAVGNPGGRPKPLGNAVGNVDGKTNGGGAPPPASGTAWGGA
jgi:hypothetical protein